MIAQPDGLAATDNPRFQTFPHESVNRRLLVETYDNLCMNCHPTTSLP
ncbi:MAG: cytochrome c3 family protein [Actinomycetota bacterium]|nr:cytochrome c3 family protein [Actinomycetota bacterium]